MNNRSEYNRDTTINCIITYNSNGKKRNIIKKNDWIMNDFYVVVATAGAVIFTVR